MVVYKHGSDIFRFSKVVQTLNYILGLHIYIYIYNCLEFSEPPLCVDEAV